MSELISNSKKKSFISKNPLRNLLKDIEQSELARKTGTGTTKRAQKEAWAVTKITPEQRMELKSSLDMAAQNFAQAVLPADKPPTTGQINRAMEEFQSIDKALTILAARKETLVKQVKNSNAQVHVANEEMDPELQPGKLESPEFGKVFSVEGGGREDPTINALKLKELLGEDVWNQIRKVTYIPEQWIPAQEIEEVDEEALWVYTQEDPNVLEIIRECLELGKPKTPKLNIRDLNVEKQT